MVDLPHNVQLPFRLSHLAIVFDPRMPLPFFTSAILPPSISSLELVVWGLADTPSNINFFHTTLLSSLVLIGPNLTRLSLDLDKFGIDQLGPFFRSCANLKHLSTTEDVHPLSSILSSLNSWDHTFWSRSVENVLEVVRTAAALQGLKKLVLSPGPALNLKSAVAGAVEIVAECEKRGMELVRNF